MKISNSVVFKFCELIFNWWFLKAAVPKCPWLTYLVKVWCCCCCCSGCILDAAAVATAWWSCVKTWDPWWFGVEERFRRLWLCCRLWWSLKARPVSSLAGKEAAEVLGDLKCFDVEAELLDFLRVFFRTDSKRSRIRIRLFSSGCHSIQSLEHKSGFKRLEKRFFLRCKPETSLFHV